MKFKLWALWQRIRLSYRKIFYSFFWIRIKTSLLYNLVEAFILVFIITYFISALAPSSAHTVLDNSEVTSIESIESKYATLYTHRNDFYIELLVLDANCTGPVKLNHSELSSLTANGNSYDTRSQLYIQPIPSKYSNDNLFRVSIDYPKNQYMHIQSASYNTESQVKTDYNYGDFTVSSLKGFRMDPPGTVTLDLKKCPAYLVNPDGEKVKVTDCTLQPASDSTFIDLSIYAPMKIIMEQSFYASGRDSFLYLESVRSANTQLSGDLRFSYTPAPTNYHLINQTLTLDCYTDLLNMELTQTNTFPSSIALSFNGMVNDASISGMELFPSFLSWYRGNAYMAPLTLVSTVLTGLTLMISRKKKYF